MPILHPVDQWAAAFAAGRPYFNAKYHVQVCTNPDTQGASAYFHHNLVARRNYKGIEMSAAGYGHSPTTRQRLNALCRALGLCAPFYQSRNQLWFEARTIGSSEWVTVLGPLGTLAARTIDIPLRECPPDDTRGLHLPTGSNQP